MSTIQNICMQKSVIYVSIFVLLFVRLAVNSQIHGTWEHGNHHHGSDHSNFMEAQNIAELIKRKLEEFRRMEKNGSTVNPYVVNKNRSSLKYLEERFNILKKRLDEIADHRNRGRNSQHRYEKPTQAKQGPESSEEWEDSTHRHYYHLLGVEKGATSSEIRKAYRKKAMKYHPDKHFGKEEKYTKKMQKIAEAYQKLNDKEHRANYDWDLKRKGKYY